MFIQASQQPYVIYNLIVLIEIFVSGIKNMLLLERLGFSNLGGLATCARVAVISARKSPVCLEQEELFLRSD